MVWRSGWLRAGRIKALAAAAIFLCLAAGGIVAGLAVMSPDGPAPAAATPVPGEGPPAQTAAPTSAPTAPPVFTHFGLLDGVGMSDGEWAKRKDELALAVMLDNAEQAFPHDGLHRADLIYEAFVEGGITRLMAVYWRRDADFLEPIRSARTPFVIWADELDALYAHGGGATTFNEANSTGQIYEWEIKDLEAFGPLAAQFYRNPDRQAPHDLGATTAKLRAGAAILGYKGPSKLAPWLFRDVGAPSPTGTPAKGVEVDFGGRARMPSQTVQYRWDEASKSYGRFQYGGPHRDARSKEPLQFTTVIAMRVHYEVADTAGHTLITDQVGSGPATIFTEGKAVSARWKKSGRRSRTRFYDLGGAEIQFARGPIFVAVLGESSTLTVTALASELPALPDSPDQAPGPAVATSPLPLVTPSRSATTTAPVSQSPGALLTPRPSATSGAPAPGTSPSAAASPPAPIVSATAGSTPR